MEETDGMDAMSKTLAAPSGPEPVSGVIPTGERYKVLKQLGRGAMGCVALAADQRLNRQVALKWVDGGDVEAQRREMELMAQLSPHPNIVTILSVEEVRGEPAIVMEYVKGRTLSGIIGGYRDNQTGSLMGTLIPVPELLRIARQIAAGLVFLAKQGVVHRDLKPDNILIEEGDDGQAKIADFGVARFMLSAGVCARQTFVAGSLSMMGPEQVVTGSELGPHMDAYALGCVLYEMVTGHILWELPNVSMTQVEVLEYRSLQLQRPLPKERHPSRFVEGLDPRLETLILGLLERDPKKRLTAAQALKLLDEIEANPQARARRTRRAANVSAAVGVLVLAILAFFGSMIWRPHVVSTSLQPAVSASTVIVPSASLSASVAPKPVAPVVTARVALPPIPSVETQRSLDFKDLKADDQKQYRDALGVLRRPSCGKSERRRGAVEQVAAKLAMSQLAEKRFAPAAYWLWKCPTSEASGATYQAKYRELTGTSAPPPDPPR